MQEMADHICAVAERRDRTAFEALFRYYAPRLKGALLRQGASAQEAEEVMQEAMVMVWRKAEQYDPAKASPSTWIYTIARNKRIDMIRRVQRPEIDPDDPYFAQEPEANGEEAYSVGERSRIIRDYIETLPEEQLLLVRKAFYEDMTHQAIATELGIPLGTVKSRLRAAMSRMRDQLTGVEL